MTFRTFLKLGSAITALSIALAPGIVHAETLEGALIKAYQYHPSLDVARAGLRVADEAVPQARAGKRPNVTASASAGYTTQDDFSINDATDNYSLGISASMDFIDGGDTKNAVSAAIAGVLQSRASLTNTEQDVLLDAITAYGDVRRDIQFVSLAENNVRVISRQLRAARDRFEVGEVTRTDVAQAQARLAAARSNLVANEGSLTRSREFYLATIGEAPVDLAPPPDLPALPASAAEAENVAMQNHPQMVAAQQAVAEAEFNVNRARASFRPVVSGTASVSHVKSAADTHTQSASIGVSADVPLYRGGALASALRQSMAGLEQSQAQLQDTGRQIRQNVAFAWSSLEVSRASIDASRQEITASRIAFEGVQEEARLGARTTLEVLDAEQELLNAQSNLVAAERDEYVAVYTLLSALGLLTVEHLGLDVESYDPVENFNAVEDGPFATGGRREILNRIIGRYDSE